MARITAGIACSHIPVLGMAADDPVTIDDANVIATSFPTFLDLFAELGASLAPRGETAA